MWQVTAVAAIVAFVTMLFYGFLRSRTGDVVEKQGRVDALEQAAALKRAEEAAADAKQAEEIIAAHDARAAIGFVLGGFRPGTSKANPVQPTGVAGTPGS